MAGKPIQLTADVVIRLVLPGDEQLFMSFFNHLSNETKTIFSATSFTSEYAGQLVKEALHVDKIRRFVVLQQGAGDPPDDVVMLGTVWLWEWNRKIVWLGIMIGDAFQNQGYGKRLIQFAVDYARQHAKGGIILTTHKTNVRAQKLYQRFHFQTIGEDSRGEYIMLLNFPEETV